MWSYDKRLQFPVKIKNPNPQTAKIVISQLGGPDGELGASMRYLNQRYAMPYKECKGILTDIGTEELAHMEMISAIVYQLTRNLTPEQIKEGGFDAYFVDHTTGFTRSRPPVCRGAPQRSSPKATRSPICLRIWQRKLHLCKNNLLAFTHHFSVHTVLFCVLSYVI